MTTFTFRLLDPRPTSLEKEIEFLDNFPGLIIGLEVTVPALIEYVNVNIDPQHDGTINNFCCIEAVINNLPIVPEWDKVLLVTVRADLDALSSMLVVAEPELLQQKQVVERLNAIAIANKSSAAKWEPKLLFQEAEDTLATVARMVSDFKLSLEERLQFLKEWLLAGEISKKILLYKKAFVFEQLQIKSDLELWKTIVEKHSLSSTLEITYVESTLRSATAIGYCSSPVVVAFNPFF